MAMKKCSSFKDCKKYLQSKEGKWLLVIIAIILFPIFVLWLLWHFGAKFSKKK